MFVKGIFEKPSRDINLNEIRFFIFIMITLMLM